MLSFATKLGIKKFVFSSSSAVYGEPLYTPIDEKHPLNPLSPYALSKAIGEQYCTLYSKIYDLSTICLRYFNAYGDRMNDDDELTFFRELNSLQRSQYTAPYCLIKT